MKKELWLVIFFVALIADLLIMQFGADPLRVLSKPLIVFSLLIYLLSQRTSEKYLSIKRLVVAALFFSMIGDVLLLFEPRSSMFFIGGLVSFLIAHVFYIVSFNSIRKTQKISFQTLPVLPVALYYFSLIFLLYNSLGDLKIPVIIYGLVISTMLVAAWQLKEMQERRSVALLLSGAVLFIASDSILALNKFYARWDGAAFAIMISYGIAQLFITISAVQIFRSHHKLKQKKVLVH
jgi:uncharacterized membrane protein YhhN